jgi:prepilin-type N-terminal cleavage/methylation domain-containing protein
MILSRKINHEDIVPCKESGFSLVELLFALLILSFGLTALVKTHSIAASTLNNSQERYHAMRIAQEFIDYALITKELISVSEKIYRNKVWYKVTQSIQHRSNNQSQITVDVNWRKSQLTLTAQIHSH